MALLEQRQAFRFAGGIDTEADPKGVPATKLLALENGVFAKATAIIKRNGYASRSKRVSGSAVPLTGLRRLAKRGDELLAFTGNRCYSYQPAIDEWTEVGPLVCAVASDRPAVRTGTEQTMPDCATNDGLTVYAWEDSGSVWWSAVATATGHVCRGPEQLAGTGERPRVVAVGSVIHVYFAVPALRTIYAAVVNPRAPQANVVAQPVVEDLSTANPVYDAKPTDRAGRPAVMAWAEHGSSSVRIGYVAAGGTLGSPGTGMPSVLTAPLVLVAGSPLGIAYRDEKILVAAHTENLGASYLTMVRYDSPDSAANITQDLLSRVQATTGLTMNRISCVFDVGGNGWCIGEIDAAQPSERYCLLADLAAHYSGFPLRSMSLASSMFATPEGVFVTLVHDTTYFNTYVTLYFSEIGIVPAGRHCPGTAAGAPARSHVPSVSVVGSVATMCLPYRERLLSENHDKFTETGIRAITLDFDNEDSHQYAELGRGLYLAGACPLHYDGRSWTEQGFHVGPEHIIAVKAPGGAMSPSVTYVYRGWYEWTDAQGEIHRGPVSIGTDVVMGGADTQVTLTLPTLRLTNKDNVRICVARSRGNDETELFRVTSADPTTAGAANGYIANDPEVDSVTFVDRMADSELEKQESLYTDGGILSNDPSPLGAIVFGAKNRLFFTDASDENAIRFSQEIDDGYGLECPPELRLKCDPFGGPITAVAAMDGLVYAFKQSAIFVAGGNGPLPNGDASQSGFTSFELVTSDVGCTDPSSIALTPIGLVFKSDKGIYLLDRSRTVIDVGGPARAYDAQTVRRATVMPGRTAVLFLTDAGKSLYYDYKRGQWSTFTNHEGLDACVVGDRYHYLRADNRVFAETVGAYTDDGRRIPLVFETAWLHLDEILQGWQHFYELLLLGTWKSPHQLKVRYRTEYSNHWSSPAFLDATNSTSSAGWITGTGARPIGEEPIGGSVYGEGAYGDGPYGGTPPGIYQWRAHLGLVGQAIQFRFEDYEAAGYAGPGYELSELVLTGGIKAPAKRPFQAARST